MKIVLAALVALSACTPAVARESQSGWSEERTCFRTEYREEYVPGTENNPGYVKSWKDTIEVSCDRYPYEDEYPNVGRDRRSKSVPMPRYRRHTTIYEDVDTNDCSDGTVVGGLLGGGLAGFGSRGKDRWWAIPSGIIGGAMLGCAVDGG